MRKLTIIGGSTLVLVWFVVWVLTVPIIDRNEHMNDISYVGKGYSTADVSYTDYRPVLNGKQQAANVWWETTDGEWRRWEIYNGFTRYSATQAVLRDVAYSNSWFGVERGSPRARVMQMRLDEVKAAYRWQSVLDRVWIWRVQEFR